MKKFWNWKKKTKNQDNQTIEERILYLNGPISDDSSWFDDDVTPGVFKDELFEGSGDITVWINSPGGDCVAAAQIFNMLKEYDGFVTVKIDGLAASAASVIAMAGDQVLMSPVSTMMIHNPSTIVMGDSDEMKKAMQMLDEVKESIINAYVMKSSLSRRELSKLMDQEYWMNANEAVSKGFVDDILYHDETDDEVIPESLSMGYSPINIQNSIRDKIISKCHIDEPKGPKTDELMERLLLIKNHF